MTLVLVASLVAGAFAAEPKDWTAAVGEDLTHEIRPGGEGRPFWNGNAIMFMYPPAFEFKTIPECPEYRFDVIDANGKIHVFRAPKPTASLKPVWDKLPTGFTTVICRGERKWIANMAITAGTRAFWKSAPFDGKYPPPKFSHETSAKKALDYALNAPSTRYLLEKGEPDPSFRLNVYPTKMLAAVAQAACTVAARETDAKRKAEAVLLARRALDWLIAHAEKDGTALPHFPPTYQGKQLAAENYKGQVMLIYPASAALAYLKFYELTKEPKYLAEAEAVAATYLKLQGEDGTWPLKLWLKDGKEISNNRLVPIAVMIPLMEKLADLTGKAVYRESAANAFANLERTRIATWNWEGQFEDVPPNAQYVNLTKHDACATAIYLAERFPKDLARLELARELLRFAEDQFVCWTKPLEGMDFPPNTSMLDLRCWVCPGVLEQYWWYNPIDASAAKLIRTYLALYRAEGKALDLAKAKALGDSLTRVQWNDGGFPTHWGRNEVTEGIWMNCHIAAALALDELARAEADASRKIRVACIGDSITWGSAMTNRVAECYPAQLQRMLGDRYEVVNFGDGGSCVYSKPHAGKSGWTPHTWRKGAQARSAYAFKPDIVISNLGINDSSCHHDELTGGEGGRPHAERGTFRREYVDLLKAFSADGRRPRIIMWTRLGPLGKKHFQYGMTYAADMEDDLRQVANEVGAETLDMYTPLLPYVETPHFANDGVHPEGGAQKVIAEQTAKIILNASAGGEIRCSSPVTTKSLQAAIDRVSQDGGGRVTVPAGVWTIGTVWLKSGVELHLVEGAVLKGSANLADYNAEDAYPQNFSYRSEGWCAKHLIIAHEVKNVAITGKGVIDGNAEAFMMPPYPKMPIGDFTWRHGYLNAKDRKNCVRPGQIIVFVESQDIRISGVTMRNMPMWTCLLHGCDRVRIDGVTIRNDLRHANTDGFDIDSCNDVVVGNCDITTGDDAFAIRGVPSWLKNKHRVCENILITNCVCACAASGVRVGVGEGAIRNVRFRDIHFKEAGHGLLLQSCYPDLKQRGVAISDISFENITIDDSAHAIIVSAGTDRAKTVLERLRFKNIKAKTTGSIIIEGAGETRPRDVSFENVELTLVPRTRPRVEEKDWEVYGRANTSTAAIIREKADDIRFQNVKVFRDAKLGDTRKEDYDIAELGRAK